MRQTRDGFFSMHVIWGTPAFLFFIMLFLAGAVAGGFTGLMEGPENSVQLLAQYALTSAQQTHDYALQLGGALCSTAGWLLLAVGAGFLSPPSLAIGLVTAARGFVLSFSAAALIGRLGLRGLGLSLATGGFAAVVTVPCLLVCATAAFLAACDVPPGQRYGYLYALGRYRGALLLSGTLSAAVCVPRVLLAPILVRLLSGV